MNETITDQPVVAQATSQDTVASNSSASGLARIAPKGIREAVPTILVLVALGGIGFLGHRTGWKIPKFAELSGTTPAASQDWCAAHSVPESECIECTPTLLPPESDFGWCKEHGVHQCPLCHPEVAQLKTVPEISKSQLNTVSLALTTKERQENNLGCTLYRSRVQFASVEAARKAGVDVEPVETRAIVESISTNGEITYDGTRVAHLTTRSPGTIWRVHKSVGDRVQQGDVLALIDAAEVGKAKSELLDALAQVEFHTETVARITPLFDKQVVSGRRMLEAETALRQATIKLRTAEQSLSNLGLTVAIADLKQLPQADRAERIRLLGLPDAILAELPESPEAKSNNLIPLVASIDGVIVFREAAPGEVVDTSRLLFEIVDTSRMWLQFNVSLEDARHLSTGQPVRFMPDGAAEEVTGQISWISTDVDKQTRTVEVRAEVDNADGRLRNETFGLGQIILRDAPQAIVVPQDAVQWDGSCFVVFVRDRDYFEEGRPKLFHTRTVRPGVTSEGFTEILVGLLPGEIVVTKGSSVLRSQILKNNLGAGCTCGH